MRIRVDIELGVPLYDALRIEADALDEPVEALIPEVLANRPLMVARLRQLEGVDQRLDAIAEAETSLLRKQLRDLRDELEAEAETARQRSTAWTAPQPCLSAEDRAAHLAGNRQDSGWHDGRRIAYRDAARRVSAVLATLEPTDGGR